MSAPTSAGPPQGGPAADAAASTRLAAASAIAAGVLALLSCVLFAAAFGFRTADAAPDLARLPATRAGLLRWGALTDMVGFYLLSVPVALHLGRRFSADRDPVMMTATVAGVIYAVIGSIGAVIVATAVPPLLGSDAPGATVVLDSVRRVVFIGMWQTLETIPWGVWMAVVGLRLRPRSAWLGGMALVVSVAALLLAAARLVGAETLVAVPAACAIVLYAVWLLAVGVRIARSGGP